MVLVFLLAISLCFDTFAVSVACAKQCKYYTFYDLFYFILVFAIIQPLFAIIGWLAGYNLLKFISYVDHWIASSLLIFIATKMLIAFFKKDEKKFSVLTKKNVFLLALATSVDSLAVGISLPILNIHLLPFIIVLFFVTAFAVLIGLTIGKNLQKLIHEQIGELFGAIILFALAIKILIEHLN